MNDGNTETAFPAVDAKGWLATARRAPSPHADLRPADTPVSLIVIHGISLPPGEFGSSWIEDFFCGRLEVSGHPYFRQIADLRVAPHLLIQRDGSLVQFVSCTHRAWHAGVSQWRGRRNCNDFSVGIELEGTDSLPYTDAQYARLAPVILALRARYPDIDDYAVAGHSDIAPGRKTDPGPAFDWERLGTRLRRAGYNFRREQPAKQGGEA